MELSKTEGKRVDIVRVMRVSANYDLFQDRLKLTVMLGDQSRAVLWLSQRFIRTARPAIQRFFAEMGVNVAADPPANERKRANDKSKQAEPIVAAEGDTEVLVTTASMRRAGEEAVLILGRGGENRAYGLQLPPQRLADWWLGIERFCGSIDWSLEPLRSGLNVTDADRQDATLH